MHCNTFKRKDFLQDEVPSLGSYCGRQSPKVQTYFHIVENVFPSILAKGQPAFDPNPE
jgi:hypothetical protein